MQEQVGRIGQADRYIQRLGGGDEWIGRFDELQIGAHGRRRFGRQGCGMSCGDDFGNRRRDRARGKIGDCHGNTDSKKNGGNEPTHDGKL